MSLKERQVIPATINHSSYDPHKLPIEKLQASDYDSMKLVQAPYFFDEDGFLCLSLEENIYVGDYYDASGGPYISDSVEKWAKEQGGYWEWVHPGAIMFVK
jgi:hypothetical protein